MAIDKEKIRQALRELAKANLSREEKLTRIDMFLGQISQTKWRLVFSLIAEENLRLGIFTLKDLFILFLRFKDYKGLHRLKNRIYVIANRMPFLFSIGWREFPIGVRHKNNHFYRPSKINPWPIEDFYALLSSCSRKRAVQVNDISGMTQIKRGKNFSSIAAPTLEKVQTYPNVGKYLLRNINLILQERNGVVENEVDRIKNELHPSYRPLYLDVPDELVHVLAKRKGIDYSIIEQILRVSLYSSQSEEEGKPVEMGIVLVNDMRIKKILTLKLAGTSFENLFLREEDWPKIREEVSRKADGEGAALMVNGKNGNLEDVRMLPENVSGDFYCFLTHPLQSNAIALLVKQSAVRVYYDGDLKYQLILNRKFGQWGCRNLEKIYDELEKKAIGKSITSGVLSLIVKISAKISEVREGAILVIGDFKEIEEYLTPESKERICRTRHKLIFEMTEDEIIRLLREDRAVFFDKKGQFLGSQITFVGPGGRHDIARYITDRSSGSLSIVVSHDTTITVFDMGRKWKIL